MSVKWERVKDGDLLWDVHSERMGNTTLHRMGSWEVRVISIDHAAGKAIVRWNGNREQTYSRRSVERLRRSPYKAAPSLSPHEPAGEPGK